MSEIEKTATDNIDVFFGKINEAADIVSAKLVAVAPEAAEALLNLIQFKGAFELATSFLWVSAFLFSFINLILWAIKVPTDDWDDSEKQTPLIIRLMAQSMACVPLFFGSIGGIIGILTFYNWLAVFYPEGAIAMKALEAVGVNL